MGRKKLSDETHAARERARENSERLRELGEGVRRTSRERARGAEKAQADLDRRKQQREPA
jgi:hypothetical protein